MTTINYTIDQYIPKGGAISINLPTGMSAAEILGGSTGVSISSIGGNVLISSGLSISSDGGTRSSTVTLTNNTGSIIQPLGPVLITMSGVELNAGTIVTLATDSAGNVVGASNPVNGGFFAFRSIRNFNPKYYPNTRKALSALQSAGTTFAVPCLGDSTTAGSDGSATGSITKSWVHQIATRLTAKGIQAGWQNVMGEHRTDVVGSSIQLADSRVSAFTAGWGLAPFNGGGINAAGVGGIALYNTTTTNALTFTPTVINDTLDIYYYDTAGFDPFTVKGGVGGVTASTPATATITGANLVKKATFTVNLGTPALNIWNIAKASAGTTIAIQGMSAYNSLLPEISLLNCGVFSQYTSYFTNSLNWWNTYFQLTSTGAGLAGSPLVIICLGVNDWLSGTPSAMQATLTTLVNGLKGAGSEVLLIIPPPSSTQLASQDTVIQAIYNVAVASNSAVVDIRDRWISQSASNSLYGDGAVHPNATGYVDIANAISEFFLSL